MTCTSCTLYLLALDGEDRKLLQRTLAIFQISFKHPPPRSVCGIFPRVNGEVLELIQQRG